MAAAVPTKVFVGNLSFKTRDADLARAFEVVGKVTSANIITRGPRSLGYGFVELSSAEEADKAIAQLNKSDLDGRQINVEIARPREETSQDGAAPNNTNASAAGRQRRPRRPRQPAPADGESPSSPATVGGDAAAKPRRARKPRVAPAGGAPAAAGGASAAPAAGAEDGRRPARRGRGRFGRFRRFRQQRTDEQPRIPSTTTLFVANLHYQIDNEGLAGIFKENNPVKAYVVQTNSGRSRGFGFVEFSNETDQQNALKAVDKKVVSERPLSVKVSQVRPPQPATAASEAPKN